MTTVRLFCAVAAVAMLATVAGAQLESPKPGPEHAQLKKMEGTWDTVMKMGGMESKGTSTYKMDVGGLWLSSKYEGDVAGQNFSGRGFDSYDAGKKKFVSVWVDSMTTTPLIMEGTYDKAKKTMTMTGQGNGKDGPNTKHKIVTQMPDDDSMNFAMYSGDAKEPDFTITYKRKK